MHRNLLLLSLGLLVVAAVPASGQQPATTDTVTVTTTVEPLPLSESDRSVNLIDTREQPLLSIT